MNNVQTNFVRYLKIEVITPVHIGAGPDKKLIKGLDYFYDNNTIKIFDISELFKDENDSYIAQISNQIALGKLFESQLINKAQITPKTNYPHDREPDEIFAHIRDGLGNIYIPGSSLKGAIRSALLGYLYQNDQNIKNIGRVADIDEIVFGNVENSVMRLMQITDAPIHQSNMALFNTKIYSMGKNFEGEWKHDLRNYKYKVDRSKFSDSGFVNVYECVKPLSESYTRITIVKNIIDQIDKIDNKKKPKNVSKILKVENTDPVVELFNMINSQTKSYLKKEIKFFEEHKGDKSDIIIKKLQDLEEIANTCSKNECLLHLGSGSGFHGITGDWQFDTHIIDDFKNIEKNKNKDPKWRGTINGELAAKTRRLIFIKNFNDYDFYPMGFVKLSVKSEDDYNSFLKSLDKSIGNPQKFSSKTEKNYNEIESTKNESNPIEIIEIKPYSGKLKQGQGGIPAEVVESGKPNKVKVLIENYTKNTILPLRNYNSELAVGTKILVKINQIKKDGEILEVGFEKLFNL